LEGLVDDGVVEDLKVSTHIPAVNDVLDCGGVDSEDGVGEVDGSERPPVGLTVDGTPEAQEPSWDVPDP